MFAIYLTPVLLTLAAATPLAPRTEGRIVGGRPAQQREFPYHVSVQYFREHICGGSIIGPRFIVTAAHCTDALNEEYLSIRAGSIYHGTGGQSVPVAYTMTHDYYSRTSQDFDITILRLTSELVFSITVVPIALPKLNQPVIPGKKATFTGWGALAEGYAADSPNLMYVYLTTISREDCAAYYQDAAKITDRMICTLEEGKDACQGDSGGPLMLSGMLIGIYSWGTGCARPNYPSVYTDVAVLRNFIKGKTGI